MSLLSWDCETFLIQPGMLAPKLVCVSYYDGKEKGLLDARDGIAFVERHLRSDDTTFIGHHVVYDFGVLCAERPDFIPLVFRAYEEGRVRDTRLRQQLIDIADGNLEFFPESRAADGEIVRTRTRHGLADLSLRLLGRELKKEGTFRLRYHELTDVPLDRWPEEAKTYAIDDAVTTWEVFQKQEKVDPKKLASWELQHRASWALHLMSCWGLRTDGERIKNLRDVLEAEQKAAHEKLAGSGIFRANGTKDMAVLRGKIEAAYRALDLPAPKTEKGAIQYGEDVLEPTGDPELLILAHSMKGAKLLSSEIPKLERGVDRPLCPSYNTIVETGRTSSFGSKTDGMNIQNPSKKGGVRECFRARPGTVFCSVDYDTIELRSLAQVCWSWFGESAMKAALDDGEDLHLVLAAKLMGVSGEEALARLAAGDKLMEEFRQHAKPANFGFPGGMGPEKYIDYAAGYGIKITLATARRLRDAWFQTFSEMSRYFKRITEIVNKKYPDGVVRMEQFHPEKKPWRLRGQVRFTQAANGFFQGLTADMAKDALASVSRECYAVESSPLFGCRPVVFMHDEIICEMSEARAHEAAHRMAELMISSGRKWMPDVPITAKPALMRRWYKGCKPVFAEGRLVPAKPIEEPGPDGKPRVKWVADHDERED